MFKQLPKTLINTFIVAGALLTISTAALADVAKRIWNLLVKTPFEFFKPSPNLVKGADDYALFNSGSDYRSSYPQMTLESSQIINSSENSEQAALKMIELLLEFKGNGWLDNDPLWKEYQSQVTNNQ